MGKGGNQDETAEQRALAEIAAKKFNRYQEVFVPLENQYMQDVLNVRTKGTYDTVGGLAAAAYQREFDAAGDKMTQSQFQAGIDPTSGAFQESSEALRRAAAARQGQGIAGAKIDNTNRFYRGLQGIIRMGTGQSAEAIGGMAQSAMRSQQQAQADAAASAQKAAGLRSIAGTIAGYGASPYINNMLYRPSGGATGLSGGSYDTTPSSTSVGGTLNYQPSGGSPYAPR